MAVRFETDNIISNAYDASYLQDVDTAKKYLWNIDLNTWYQTWPFEIVVKDFQEDSEYIYALPIPPESLTISPIIASEATPTFGGVVEETSENVFWAISLNGTTGVAINRPDSTMPAKGEEFRELANGSGLMSGVMNQVAEAVTQAADIVDAFTSGNTLEVFNLTLGNKLWFNRSAVDEINNGYYEMLLLRKFLHSYSILKNENPNRWALYFKHHKANQQYRVVLKDFRIMQSKESPYTLRYAMSFKGWEGTDVDGEEPLEIDRFSKEGDLYTANTLTATGALTKLGKLTQIIRQGAPAIVDALFKVKPII